MKDWTFDVPGRSAKHASGMVIRAKNLGGNDWEVKPDLATLPIRSHDLSSEDNFAIDAVISQRVTSGGTELIKLITSQQKRVPRRRS